jgi:hypothetical protein
MAATPRLAHTGGPADGVFFPNQPQRRFSANPRERHTSHFQAAVLDIWKWKATISFFVVLP